MNLVVLRGGLSSPPRIRTLPSGDTVANLELTTRDGVGTRSVPVAVHRPSKAVRALGAGAEVVVVGAVSRRFFSAGGATQSRTEVVADRVVSAGSRRGVATALDRAARRLETVGDGPLPAAGRARSAE